MFTAGLRKSTAQHSLERALGQSKSCSSYSIVVSLFSELYESPETEISSCILSRGQFQPTGSSLPSCLLLPSAVSQLSGEARPLVPAFTSGVPRWPQTVHQVLLVTPWFFRPHNFSSGSWMERLSNLQKEGKRERERGQGLGREMQA